MENSMFKWNAVKASYKHLKLMWPRPLIFPRIASGFFQKTVLRRNVLRGAEFAVTYDCNAVCEYCYSRRIGDKNKKPLTVEQIEQVWEKCMKLGAIQVDITGGEPLMRKDVIDIVKALKPNKTLITLVTNGYYLTKDMAKQLKDAGLCMIQISLDSPIREEHDKLCGLKGCWDRAMKGIEYCREVKLPVCLSSVITPRTIRPPEKIWNLVNMMAEHGDYVLLTLAAEAGAWGGRKDILLTEKDIEEIHKLRKHPNVRQDTMFNFNFKNCCPAGTEKIYITAYGDVVPCMLVQVSFGNLLEEPLEVIRERMYKVPFFKQRAPECLRYESKDFVEKVVDKIPAKSPMPLPASEHPYFKKFI